jgi:NAD(P)-dependent dehydrogenase (short-subunit alcohol dehydrogenase family)
MRLKLHVSSVGRPRAQIAHDSDRRSHYPDSHDDGQTRRPAGARRVANVTPGPVLITGCSSGIGRATAVHLAGRGHVVYATARHAEAIADLRERGCRTLALDVTVEASMRAAVEHVVGAHGAVGALVNNAGYSQSGAIETITIDDLRRQFETNVFGLVRMCQLVLPGMRAAGAGRIVNVSSMGGNFTFPGGGAYHASKYAVEAISDALRFEVSGFGIAVAIIQPGIIRTGFDKAATAVIPAATGGPYDDFNAAVARSTTDVYVKGPLARLGGEPVAVARAIARAIEADRPRARYRVTPSAKLLVPVGRLLSGGLWDRFLASQFPRPG